MRVLVVDQDSASNEAISRSLRELFTVDAVTNKGDCLDLLRSNTFEAIVATERLEDGSGLELLGQIAKKWPSVLRIFAADRERLKLLRGRLGPFELFQTLSYPIDPDRLIATLNLAEAAQGANAEHVELSGDSPDVEEPEESEQPEESAQSGEFPAPQPLPRAATADQTIQTSRGGRGASYRVGSSPTPAPRRGTTGSVARVSAVATAPARVGIAPSRDTAPGLGLSPRTGRPLRSRVRGPSNRPPPVRFPPLERVPPLEPPQGSRSNTTGDSFAEAAAMARAARPNFESSQDDLDTRKRAVRLGGAAAAGLLLVWLGFRMFGSKAEAPPPPRPAVPTSQYSQEVTELVAKIEASLQADDFNAVRMDVDKLRQLAPSHPRLAFFEGILIQRADRGKGGPPAVARGTVTRPASSQSGGSFAPDAKQAAKAGGKLAATSNDASRVSGAVGARPARLASGSAASGPGASGSGASGSGASGLLASRSAASGSGVSGSAPSVSSPRSARDEPGPAPASSGGSVARDRTLVAGGNLHPGAADSSNGPVLPPETPPGLTRPSAAPGTSSDTSAPPPSSGGSALPSSTRGTVNVGTSTQGSSASGTAASANSEPEPKSGVVTSTALASGSSAAAGPASAASAAPGGSLGSGTSAAARRRPSSEPPPVIREAKLIRRVDADYPSAAKRDGTQGFVDLEITVSERGTVEDVSVIQAMPVEIFDKAAVAAVRKWKYDPRFVDGLPTKANLKVRVEFAPR